MHTIFLVWCQEHPVQLQQDFFFPVPKSAYNQDKRAICLPNCLIQLYSNFLCSLLEHTQVFLHIKMYSVYTVLKKICFNIL